LFAIDRIWAEKTYEAVRERGEEETWGGNPKGSRADVRRGKEKGKKSKGKAVRLKKGPLGEVVQSL